MARSGKRIRLPAIEESNCSFSRFAKINDVELGGRPSKVMKRLMRIGFLREWWGEEIYEELIVDAWREENLKSDTMLFTLPFKYLFGLVKKDNGDDNGNGR